MNQHQEKIDEDSAPTTSPDPEGAATSFARADTNPRNWSRSRKWITIAALSAMTFVTCLAPAIFAPAIAQTMIDFGQPVKSKLASIAIAIYVLGWASGPLIVAPLSELFGRLWVYHASNALFVAFSAACAASGTLPMLIVFRFLAGCCGSAVLNIGGGTVADLFDVSERGTAMTVWTVGALIGPICGPIIGGFLAVHYGWRSTLWLTAGAGAFTAVIFAIVMRETYGPVLEHAYLSKTGNLSCNAENESRATLSRKLRHALKRPLYLLAFSPVVLMASIYIAIVYGYQYILITTLPSILQQEDKFTISQTGLGYLGLGLGMLISLAVFGASSDRLMRHMARSSTDGKMLPKHRLLPLLVATPLVPSGIFCYGWAAQTKAHWGVVLLGTGLLGAGLNATLMSLQTYLIDAFTVHAASVLAASTILRSLSGAFLPLAAPGLFSSLGYGWGCTLLGSIALCFIPMPVIFLVYGEDLRHKTLFNKSIE